MQSSWAIIRLAAQLKTRFEAGWHALPAEHLMRWGLFVLIGLVAVIALLFGGIALLGVTAGRGEHFAWEETVLRLLGSGPVTFSTAVWLQTLGTDFMLLAVVLTTAGLAVWNGRPLLAISIVLSLVVMDAIVRIGWFSLERQRPDIIAQGIAAPGFHSFPSGHTAKTVVLYGLLAAQWVKASHSVVERLLVLLLVLAIAVVVPFGRLRMGVHWPTDIMGGYLLAFVWLTFMLVALRYEHYARER
ncbi:MAG: phosphatase PAP2 family protein [Gemmatimonadota bacterium]